MACKRGWYKNKPGHKAVGVWAWDNDRLWSKIEVSLDTQSCWPYSGAMSPTGALMGAWKQDSLTGEFHQQMTQARRLVYMSETGEDVTPYQVTMTCANQSCCNSNHFELKPTNRPDKEVWKIFGDDSDNRN